MSINDCSINFLYFWVVGHLLELLEVQIATLVLVGHVKHALQLVFSDLYAETCENEQKLLNLDSA